MQNREEECRLRRRKFQLFRKIGLEILEQPIESGVMFKFNFNVVRWVNKLNRISRLDLVWYQGGPNLSLFWPLFRMSVLNVLIVVFDWRHLLNFTLNWLNFCYNEEQQQMRCRSPDKCTIITIQTCPNRRTDSRRLVSRQPLALECFIYVHRRSCFDTCQDP